jgi:hypothetical protein
VVNIDGIGSAQRAIRSGSLTAPCLWVLPVTGVAVAALPNPMQSQTFEATDKVASRIDELQFDLGEGPAWTAVRFGLPVLIPDLRSTTDGGRWPLFDDAAQDLPARGLFVFPLLVGTTPVGVLTLYRNTPGLLNTTARHTATALARDIAPVLAQRILSLAPVDQVDPADPNDRSEIYQATGFVMVQQDLTAETAFARIQAHAFSTGSTMAHIASAVMSRSIHLPDERNAR